MFVTLKFPFNSDADTNKQERVLRHSMHGGMRLFSYYENTIARRTKIAAL